MLTGIAADAAIITVGAEGAVIITDGTEAAVTTSVTGKPSLYSPSSPIARTKVNCSDANGSRLKARPVRPAPNCEAWSIAKP